MTTAQAFELGLQHHQAGRLVEAEALYRQVLAAEPGHAGAWQLLGLIAHQRGQNEMAQAFLAKSIALDSGNPSAHSNLGGVYRALGRFDDAIASYQRALQIKPDSPEVYNNLGNVLRDRGHADEAIAAYRQALRIRPDDAGILFHLGLVLADRKQWAEVADIYRRVLELQPDAATAWNNLGNVLRQTGRTGEAIAFFQRAIDLQPDLLEAFTNLSMALIESDRAEEAIEVCRRALALRPDYAEASNNLGVALEKRGLPGEAVAAYQHAIECNPSYAEAYNNLGGTLVDLGRLPEGEMAYRRALKLKPDFADAALGLSLILLLSGDWKAGWPLYEERWNRVGVTRRQFARPMWDGSMSKGSRILIHAEQGFGDCIQLIRYAKLVAERGARVIVECPWPLVRLFQGVEGVHEIVASGDPFDSLPPFDFHFPMFSLPLAFETRAEAVPGEVPYLFADAGLSDVWAARLGGKGTKLRVGLAWAGNPEHRRNRERRIPPELLTPLLGVENVEFHDLQMDRRGAPIPDPAGRAPLIDYRAHISDFADTAALMAQLDLILCADTAVGHLAGALGRPVWTLLPFAPDWRWGLEKESTPWYPTMRLFRQPALGAWEPVIERIAQELRRAAQEAKFR